MRNKKHRKRKLSLEEINEANRVFRNSLNLDKVTILENSLFAKTGKIFAGKKQLGVSLFHTIHFTKKINCKKGSGEMAWLIHELMHVWQFENIGIKYIPLALYAQHFTVGKYNYGGLENLRDKNINDFNIEQQAEIVKDYYLHLCRNSKSEIIFLYEKILNGIINFDKGI